MPFEFAGITQIVADVAKSKHFYEEVLGFEPGGYYAPTRWQPYPCQGNVYFAVGEEKSGSTEQVSFLVPDVEVFWEKVKNVVDVVEPLVHTPWGTYRFVIRDPDGHLLAFGQK